MPLETKDGKPVTESGWENWWSGRSGTRYYDNEGKRVSIDQVVFKDGNVMMFITDGRITIQVLKDKEGNPLELSINEVEDAEDILNLGC